MKKAGNMRYGYERSAGEFILVLDADFAVRSDFLEQTLPYFDDDELGILQTPQFFRISRTTGSSGALPRSRSTSTASACALGTATAARSASAPTRCTAVGTRRAGRHGAARALRGHLHRDEGPRRRLPRRLPAAALAAGSAPDNTEALGSQQYRWARGNFALAGTPLFKRLRLHRCSASESGTAGSST